LSKLPWFKDIFKSVSITHGYKSTLTVNSFETNQLYVDEAPFSNENLNTSGNYYTRFDIPGVVITEQFSPLIGVDIKTVNDMTFRADFKKSRNLEKKERCSKEEYQNSSRRWARWCEFQCAERK